MLLVTSLVTNLVGWQCRHTSMSPVPRITYPKRKHPALNHRRPSEVDPDYPAMKSLSSAIESTLANSFESWGLIVARRPWAVLWSSVLLALCLAVGVTQMHVTGEAQDLWAVRERGYRDIRFLSQCCGSEPNVIVIYLVVNGAGSIFDRVAMLEVLRAHEWVTSTLRITRGDGTQGRFRDVCQRDGDECSSLLRTASLLGMAFNYSSVNVPSSDAAILSIVNSVNSVWPIQQQVAEPVLDAAGDVVSSRGITLRYALADDGSEDDVTFALAVDDLSRGVRTAVDPSVLTVTHWSEAGLDEEFARVISGDIPLFVIALNLVVLFLSLNLGRTRPTGPPLPDMVRGRFLLAWMSISSVILAVLAGFGVAAVLGATFHSVIATMPLIALGVQVDDCIITVNALWQGPHRRASLEERFAKSLRESGPCITTTSLTTVTAFAIGTSAALPGVRFFCLFAASVFAFGWLFQVSFFYACVVLDERRMAKSRDCICGAVVLAERPADGDAKDAITPFQRLLGCYADVLLHPPVALLAACCFGGLTALACALVSDLTVGLPLTDVLPDDSYIRDAFDTATHVFRGRPTPITIVVLDEDFNDARARERFHHAVGGVGNLSFVMAAAPDWMTAYEAWGGGGTVASGGLYLDQMARFLAAEPSWQDDVQCATASCTSLVTAKFVVFAMMARPGGSLMDELRLRDAIDALLRTPYPAGNVVVASPPFQFAESDEGTWVGVISTCCLACAGILGVCCCMVSTSTALVITLSVAMIDIDLLLLAYAWQVRLNSISYVCLVMACGLAVDYCVHIGHAFDHAVRDPRWPSSRAAAKQAIIRMGASVFQGGITTMLGILVLALASSVAFRTLFRFVLGTVLLGIMHGVVVLPILLTYLTPRIGPCCMKPVATNPVESSTRTVAKTEA